MKRKISLFAAGMLILLASCKKNNTPELVLNEMPDSSAMTQTTGVFNNGPYGNVSGTAKVLLTGTKYELKLMNSSSSELVSLFLICQPHSETKGMAA